jgi:sec-independent protein translocase protein TatC
MSEDPEEHAMTLWEHLEELRSRLVKMALAFAIGAIAAWNFRHEIFEILTIPFVAAWDTAKHGPLPKIHFQSPAAAFIAFVKLSGLAGFVAALPIMLYQVWAFIAPGLYAKEKRWAIPFVATSCLLFAGGAYFGWRFAFPAAFQFLLGMGGEFGKVHLEPTLMFDGYIEFVSHMLLAFGTAAELPVVAFFLSVIGVITHRHLIKFFRYFVVIAFVIAAVITPPDPLSQFMLAVPLIGLYGISILIAYVFAKKKSTEGESVAEQKT